MIKAGLRWSVPLLVLALLASAIVWPRVPEGASVPVHWNLEGEADGFASRDFALLFAPVLMAGLIPFFAVLPRLDPKRAGLERSAGLYLTGWVGCCAILLLLHLVTLWHALGREAPVGAITLTAVALLFVVMGNFIAKSQPNWFAGLRTPWTLSSRDAWLTGNRTLGWGFVASGALAVLGLLVGGPPLGLGLLVAGSLASSALGTYRSWAVWRAGTQR